MQPLKLKIKGINSFTDEQIIDFEKLTSRNIFGIFGPTGSGKSTILDAVTLALYDKISRNTREFINKEEKKAAVSFEFAIKNGDGKRIFCVERGYKKNKDGITQASGARLIEYINQNTFILAEKSTEVTEKIISIIGLNYNDFTRSVVLPQGKFSEFLTLKNQERRDMLERIFRLEKYGKQLTAAINNKKNIKEKALKQLETKLEFYEDTSDELLSNTKEQIKIQKNQLKDITIQVELMQKQLQDKKNNFELCEELSSFNAKKFELEKNAQNIELNRVKLDNAVKAEEVKPILESFRENERQFNINSESLKKLNEKYTNLLDDYEEAKKVYDDLTVMKDTKYPELVKNQEIYRQALELKKENDELYNVILNLRKQYIDENKKSNDLKIKLDELGIKKEEYSQSLEDIKAKKQKYYILPEFKSDVIKGSELEKRFSETKTEINIITSKINEFKNQKEQLQIQFEDNDKLLNEFNNQKQILINDKINLDKNLPKSNDEIIKLGEELNLYKSKFEDFKNNSKKLQSAESQYKILEENKKNYEFNLSKLNLEISKEQEFLEITEREIENYKNHNMASILSKLLEDGAPCPVCGAVHHPQPAEVQNHDISLELNERVEKSKKIIDDLNSKFNKISVDLKICEGNLSTKKQEIDEIKCLLGDTTEESINKNLEQKEVYYNESKSFLEKYNNQKNDIELKIEEISRKLNSYTVQAAALGEKLKSIEIQISENHASLNEKNLKLQEYKSKISQLKNKLLIQCDFSEKEKEISQKEKIFIDLEKQENDLTELSKNIQKQQDEFTPLFNQAQNKVYEIKTNGNSKKSLYEKNNQKINEITNGEDPKKLYDDCLNQAKMILESHKQAQEKYNLLEIEKNNCQKSIAEISKIKETFNDIKNNDFKRLNEKISVLGFESIESAEECILDKTYMSQLKNEIDEYNESLKNININIMRIQNKLQGIYVTKQQLEEFKAQYDLLAENQDSIKKSIALLEESAIKLETKLIEKNEILKLSKKAINEFNVVQQLAKTMEGSRFIEYIATNQLEYITVEASKRLKEITGGRYALELDGSDFIIRDDFNGGNRRAPSTLSGGEIFLTSFALALALSSKIQMKNAAPLEFFFLDEGFGTLDSQLLDTVMTSLESLKKDNLSVGVISHVEELKSRIPVKLTVKPAKQGISGTRVKIEYN